MPAVAPAALHAEPVRSHEQFAAVWQDALHQISDPQLETVRLCCCNLLVKVHAS